MNNSGHKKSDPIKIDGNSLNLQQLEEICLQYRPVELSRTAIPGIQESRRFVEKLLDNNETVYGITTGVGELANKRIPPQDAVKLQENLIRTHAVNVGEPLSREVVRCVILLRANALAKGYSGIRLQVIQTLLTLLNKNLYPYIPSQGSVGASGDLSPLAHLALFLLGEGEALDKGERVPAGQVLEKAGIKPVKLLPKEGLALINGTQVMAALGCLTIIRAENLFKHALIASAMSLEALKGTTAAYDPKIHAVRRHQGQIECARMMRELTKESAIIASHKGCFKVQDAYSLRCVPQIMGPIAQTIGQVKELLLIEINSATDNPLIFAKEQEVISGGNFHGEPLALYLDYLGIALAEIANLSERTIERLVNPHLSGLPPFLIRGNGLNTGFMIPQYTAAALVSENKSLAHPASVDSIPTSANQEDHVSMGSIAARHAWEILKNSEHVISIHLLASSFGLDFWQEEAGKGTKAAYEFIRKRIKPLKEDRILYKELETMKELLDSGEIIEAVNKELQLFSPNTLLSDPGIAGNP